MARTKELPTLWLNLCRLAGLEADASIDRVLAACGNAVGRGTIQRIHQGGSPRMASLEKIVDHFKVGLDQLVSTDERQRAGDIATALSDWKLQASPRSLQVIELLSVLAQKNALKDEDWAVIEQLAARFKKP